MPTFIDYTLNALPLATNDGRIVAYVYGRVEIEIKDGNVHDMSVFLEDEVRYATGQHRCDQLNPQDPFFGKVFEQIVLLWKAGKIPAPSPARSAEMEAADAADNRRKMARAA